MVLTQSKGLELGMMAPNFTLYDTVSGKNISLSQKKGKKGIVVMFLCNHCPFVLHINDMLVQLATKYQEKGIQFIAISSNDAESYPQDGPENMTQVANDLQYSFPYLYDESQEVARAYNAVCTPDIFFFGVDGELIYHGQLDDSRPGANTPVTGIDFSHALDTYLESGKSLEYQKPSIGCSIKWK